MFGKIKDFKVNDNIIKVRFENIEAKINIISPNIINFFVPNFRDEQTSVAIENLKIQHCTYEIDRFNKTFEYEYNLYHLNTNETNLMYSKTIAIAILVYIGFNISYLI